MMHGRKKTTLVFFIVAACMIFILAGVVVQLKVTYNGLVGMAGDLLWLLNENKIGAAHDLFDPEAGKIFTARDMALVDRQMDRLIGGSGSLKWAGTFRFTWIAPLTVVIKWKVNYSLAKDPVEITMSFIKREGKWRIGGLWYDSQEVRAAPLLVSLRCAASLDEKLKPEDVKEEFAVNDEYIYLWTLWQGLNGRHAVRMRWVDPSGAVYHEFTYDVKDKPERKSRIVWSRIGLKDPGSPVFPGEWKVKIMLDSRVVEETSVMIRLLK